MKILKLLELLRPKQWIKNLFIFAPLLFAGELLHFEIMIKSLIAFFAFCGTSSIVYIINDILDREADKVHKEKKFRPIASGEVSIKNALLLASILLVITIILSSKQNVYFWFILLIYFFLNILYSIWIKHIVILDLFFISAGFMLRVIAGAVAIWVPLSSWMILTTIFISLFLAISKRRAELVQGDEENVIKQRRVLYHYDTVFLDQMNTIAATGTIICYALYTVSEKAVTTFHTENLIYTTPFVIYGIFRYLYLIHIKKLGENPANILTKDLPLIINALLWFVISVLIIYKSKGFIW
ncbi:MAG: decaprenyl-phosphate phosphoribosyltransferase [Ignavibacteria bacterium]|nr:decaprenyl-phosphate phosphoribosyltransferase [Ignavibacteria bacterium]